MKKLIIFFGLNSSTSCIYACILGTSCVNGKCVPIVPPPSSFQCSADSDCKTGNICKGRMCIPDPTTLKSCTTSADCSSSEKCQYGACVPSTSPVTCSPACSTDFACDKGKCVPIVPPPSSFQCSADTDCKTGNICKGRMCIADPTTLISCTDSSTCASTEICQYGACVPASSTCVPACSTDFTCDNGQCVPIIPPPSSFQCSVDSDCKAGNICKGRICIADPANRCVPSCLSSQQCLNGVCVSSSTTTSSCVPACTGNFACESGQCVPIVFGPGSSSQCTTDSDCKTGNICKGRMCIHNPNSCVPACSSDFACDKGKCVPIVPPPSSFQCSVDTDCKTGNICKGRMCIPDPTKQKACSSSTPCGTNEKCVYGVCVKNTPTTTTNTCKTKSDCAASQICNPSGSCVTDKCYNKNCLSTQKCVNGQCVPSTGSTQCNADSDCTKSQICKDQKCVKNSLCKILCLKGTICKNGACVPDITVCPADASYKTTVCTDPRPNEKTCQPVQYFRAPDPLFCGVKGDGTRVNFPRECEACKDTSIVYYFDKPCHKVPFVCNKGDTCTDAGYCSSTCTVSQECPYDWQICSSGRCVDQCTTMKCAAGPCKFGQCQFVEASGSCTLGATSGCKKDQWSCVGFECADLCVRQACPAYQKCNPKSGACEKITIVY